MKTMKKRTLFYRALILPMTAQEGEPLTFEGWVGVEGNRIVLLTTSEEEADRFSREADACQVIDCRGRLLMPGLINTHCHVAMTLQRCYADDIALMEWLNRHIWPFEAQQRPDEVALGAELGIAEMLLGGVTSFVDMYWDEYCIARVAQRLGIRALLCPSFIDGMFERNVQDLEATLPLASDRVRVGVGPHAPYSVKRENLLRCKELCQKYNLPLTIHVAESRSEMEQLQAATGMSPVEWLDSLGLLDDKTIAAHCVYLSERDRAILRERGVKIAHNPTSNMKIASGIAPVATLLKEGICTTLATDGPSSNNDLDMWEEMRQASFLAKVSTMDPLVLPAYEVLKMATRYGAMAIGHADDLGMVREGALADLILIDLNKPHLQPLNDVVAALVYCAKASDVETVMVDGELLVENRQLTGVDLPALYEAVNKALARIKGAINR